MSDLVTAQTLTIDMARALVCRACGDPNHRTSDAVCTRDDS